MPPRPPGPVPKQNSSPRTPDPQYDAGPLRTKGPAPTCPPDVYSPANAPVIEVAAARRAGNTAASSPATTDSATNTAI